MKTRIAQLVDEALERVPVLVDVPELASTRTIVERTRDPKHGDFATNIAMRLAKSARTSPRELAAAIIEALPDNRLVEKVEIAGPGFINFFVSEEAFREEIATIIAAGDDYGRQPARAEPRILLEFVSANPTGPLHVGHGRHAAFGATVGNLLEAAGYPIYREYYVNDAGRQMNILALSVMLRALEASGQEIEFPAGGYQGDYIAGIAADADVTAFSAVTAAALFADIPGDDEDRKLDALIARSRELAGDEAFDTLRRHALGAIRDDIEEDLAGFGVTFDNWYSEESLTTDRRIDAALAVLEERRMLYEKDGATWFRSTDYGDEKDRVVVRADGNRTYFASDIAYHFDKRERGHDHLIDVLGADHHGYVTRVRAGMEAMGYAGDSLEVPFIQFVSLYRGGEKQQMSTRSGEFVTLRQLRGEVGDDAARFFYVMRSNDQHLDFDLDLAKERTRDNPVFYLQYAHARVHRVMQRLNEKGFEYDESGGLANLHRLTEEREKRLMSSLSRYPEVIEVAATGRAPQQLAHYLRDLANDFHANYQENRIIQDDGDLRNARLVLSQAVRTVIANGLRILGVSAPVSM